MGPSKAYGGAAFPDNIKAESSDDHSGSRPLPAVTSMETHGHPNAPSIEGNSLSPSANDPSGAEPLQSSYRPSKKRRSHQASVKAIASLAGKSAPSMKRKAQKVESESDPESKREKTAKRVRNPKTKSLGFNGSIDRLLVTKSTLEVTDDAGCATSYGDTSSDDIPQKMQQYVDTMPSDVDEKLLRADEKVLAQAIKRFNPQKADNDTYIVPGILTPLKIWQFVTAERMLVRERAKKDRGGALCSDMGMGKTLTMLACIVHTKMTKSSKARRNTLVVVPNVNISRQWMTEAQERCDMAYVGTMEFYKKSDPRFRASPALLQKTDIIFTTYDEVRNGAPSQAKLDELRADMPPNQLSNALSEVYQGCTNPLFNIIWIRVVLDEAHVIKNYRSQTAMAVLSLQKNIGWAITGTPVSNTSEELYPYWRFIGDKYSASRPEFLERYRDTSDGNMTDAVSEILIRWRLDDKFLGKQMMQLPRQSFPVQYINLSKEEVIVHEALKRVFRRIINSYLKELQEEDKSQHASSANTGSLETTTPKAVSKNNRIDKDSCAWCLNYILRLRQASIHPYMLEEAFWEDFTIDELGKLMQDLQNIDQAPSSIPVHQQLGPYPDRSSPKSARNSGDELAGPVTQDTQGAKFNLHVYLQYIINTRRVANPKCMNCSCGSMPLMQGTCQHFVCVDCLADITSSTASKIHCKFCHCQNMKPLERFQHLKLLPHISEEQNNGIEQPAANSDGSLASRRALKRSQKGMPKAKSKLPRAHKPGDDMLGFQPTPTSTYRDMLRLTDYKPHLPLIPSAKLAALKETVLQWQSEGPEDKIIVFSQYIQFAQTIGRMLMSEGFSFLYYFGDSNPAVREKALTEFHNNPKARILIASLNCGGQSLNIACANRVIIMEPWWNLARENQAFGRVVRLGQEKETILMRIVARGTIEDDMKDSQHRKLNEIQNALLERRLSSNTSLHRIFSFIGKPRMENGKIVELVSNDEDVEEIIEEQRDSPF